MANSERKIIRGVRVGGKTYVSGQEDDLINSDRCLVNPVFNLRWLKHITSSGLFQVR